LGLLVTAVMLLTTIEAAFNQIFRVATPRSPMSRLLLYGTAMTLGPILLGASFSLSAWFWAARDWASQAGFSALAEAVTLGAPQALLILALTLLYAAVPNCRVAPADAAAGGVLAGLAFTLLRWGFGLYVADDQTYENIYGAMAVLPLSLLWLYLSWAVVLSGAELVAALPEWRRGDPN
ncbi:MAG TPA: YihY family inner membrane protein, partial [Rhodospirillaceae bacterium]|nr:YihY family inner membrane protein [Rhodospirillaceae bacterium]